MTNILRVLLDRRNKLYIYIFKNTSKELNTYTEVFEIVCLMINVANDFMRNSLI